MKKGRTKAAAFTIALCAGIAATGTFAWLSAKQKATNEFYGRRNPGARLHDDFNGENKDVYVENYTNKKDGVNIYARIMLREYMYRIKEDPVKPEGEKVVVGDKDPNIKEDDPHTWKPYLIEETNNREIRDYWELSFGNKEDRYYLPTKNTDNDNEDADINGTYAGADKDKETGDPYDDYKDYESYYGQDKPIGGQKVKKNTVHAQVITMQEWQKRKKPVGDFWVYDTDGWAYYARAIKPQETTGLLLDKVTPKEGGLPELYYYGIQAEAQFATVEDVTEAFESEADGSFVSENGKELLDTVTGKKLDWKEKNKKKEIRKKK